LPRAGTASTSTLHAFREAEEVRRVRAGKDRAAHSQTVAPWHAVATVEHAACTVKDAVSTTVQAACSTVHAVYPLVHAASYTVRAASTVVHAAFFVVHAAFGGRRTASQDMTRSATPLF